MSIENYTYTSLPLTPQFSHLNKIKASCIWIIDSPGRKFIPQQMKILNAVSVVKTVFPFLSELFVNPALSQDTL